MTDFIVGGLAGMFVFTVMISTFLEGLEIVLDPLFATFRQAVVD